MVADTVSHGGGSSSGQFVWSLTLMDNYSSWTELSAIWGDSGGEVCVGLRRIEERMPFAMLGFDCDNGSEFLNTVVEGYLLGRGRDIKWTRSRPYKKNDQAHVEQKNFTHVRQLLGYGRYGEIELVELVNDLYENAWLPLRNNFTPVMKLVEKTRIGSKVKKKYDTPQTPCDRLLKCPKVSAEIKKELRNKSEELDSLELSEEIEIKLKAIHQIIDRIEEQRAEEATWANEASACAGSAPALVAPAPRASTPPAQAENLVKRPQKKQKNNQRPGVMNHGATTSPLRCHHSLAQHDRAHSPETGILVRVYRRAATEEADRRHRLDLMPCTGRNEDGIAGTDFAHCTIDVHDTLPLQDEVDFLAEFVVMPLGLAPCGQARLGQALVCHRCIGGIKDTADRRSVCGGK